MLNVAQFPVPVQSKHKSLAPVSSPIPLAPLDPAIEQAIRESCPYKASTWRKDVFDLARSLYAIADLPARWRKGERALFKRIVSEWFSRYLDSRYDQAIVWNYFESVAFPGVRFPRKAEGEVWAEAWRRALDSVCGRRSDPVATSIIAQGNYRSIAMRLTVSFVLQLQRIRPGQPFRLSSYKLCDQLVRELGSFDPGDAYRLLSRLVHDGQLEIVSRGTHGGSGRNKANEYLVRGL